MQLAVAVLFLPVGPGIAVKQNRPFGYCLKLLNLTGVAGVVGWELLSPPPVPLEAQEDGCISPAVGYAVGKVQLVEKEF